MEKIEFIPFYDSGYEKHAKNIINTVYLHGDIEDLVGYDCCGVSEIDDKYVKTLQSPDGKDMNFLNMNGIFDVSVKGIDKPCVGYFWVCDYSKYFISQKGLIVFKDDKVGNEYALKKYNEKSKII